MGTEVLYPHDLLARQLTASLPRRKTRHRSNYNSNTNASSSSSSSCGNGNTRPRKRREAAKGLDMAVYGTERLGPDPSAVPKLYAGSGFTVSPAPSALPMPSFSRKEEGVNQSATKDLLRILRLV